MFSFSKNCTVLSFVWQIKIIIPLCTMVPTIFILHFLCLEIRKSHFRYKHKQALPPPPCVLEEGSPLK